MDEVLNLRGFSFTIFIICYFYLLQFTDYIPSYLSICHVFGRIAQWSSVRLELGSNPAFLRRFLTSFDFFYLNLSRKSLKSSQIFCLAYFFDGLNSSKFI
jgi:hypothetical protein